MFFLEARGVGKRRRGERAGGEMAQTTCTHMNKCIKIKK
jgi:hypothetical protein